MKSSFFSWEIVLAGLAFIGIALYLFDRDESHRAQLAGTGVHVEHPGSPAAAPMPTTVVIDLQNLESLKNLENLKNLDNLKNLEVEFRNLDKIIQEHTETIEESAQSSVEQSLQQIEQNLQNWENGDFNIRLQDHKVFIKKNFNVKEAAWSEVSSGVYVFRESFDLAGDGTVDLNLSFGNVNVVGGNNDSGELVLQATGNIESPDELRDKLAMTVSRGDQQISFNISSKESYDISDRINLEATLTLPETARTHIKTDGGHIKATHLRGSQQLVTSGGHITLDDLSGGCTVKTSGGHITGDRLAGECTLTTAGGHIKLNRADGKFDLSTGGGHIEIQNFKGEGVAKTSGGNISASLASVAGPLSFNSAAGNISLRLPTSISADIALRGTNVSMDNAFSFNGSRSDGEIIGTLNSGGIPITAGCGYGNVALRTHE